MHRREVLNAVCTAGLLGALAGCSSDNTENRKAGYQGPPTEEPGSESRTKEPLNVSTFDYHEGTSGNLVVTVSIENTTQERQQATLTVTVEADGQTSREETDVSLAGGETGEYEIPFDVSIEAYHDGGKLNLSLE